MNPIHALASHLPLFRHVFVNDVANVADEDDVLLLTILRNPIGDRLENGITNDFVAGRIGLCVSSAICLRIWNDGDRKRTCRGRRELCVVSQNGRRAAGQKDLQGEVIHAHVGSVQMVVDAFGADLPVSAGLPPHHAKITDSS